MEFTCAKDELQAALQRVARAVSPRTTLPVLSNILIKAEADGTGIAAYDLNMAIQTTVPAKVTRPGETTIPARLLQEIMAALPAEEVKIDAEEQTSMSVLTCARSNYRIHGQPAQEFPALPVVSQGRSVKIPQALLKTMIHQTGFASAEEETRPIMTGTLFLLKEGKLTLVATDTYRLAARSATVPGLGAKGEKEVRAVVPTRALREVERLLEGDEEEVEVTVGSTHASFRIGETVVTSALIEGHFPDHTSVIPTEYYNRIRVDRKAFEEALRRAQIVAKENSNKIILRTHEGLMSVEASSPGIGQMREETPVEVEGEDIVISFNAKFLLDALGVMGSEHADLELKGAASPGLLKPGDGVEYSYVLMPIHVPADEGMSGAAGE